MKLDVQCEAIREEIREIRYYQMQRLICGAKLHVLKRERDIKLGMTQVKQYVKVVSTKILP